MPELNSLQNTASYRNLLAVFEKNGISYEQVTRAINKAVPYQLEDALEKVSERGLDFEFIGGELEFVIKTEGESVLLSMIAVYEPGQSTFGRNTAACCHAYREELAEAAVELKIGEHDCCFGVLEI